jgi:hypothetical protein
VELLLYAALFTLWQCTASLPAGATAIASFGGRAVAWTGPGYRVFSPWPGDLALVLEGVRYDGEGRAERSGALPPEIARAFSLDGFRADLASVRRETRLLRRCCELYLLAVFAALPAIVRLLGEEAGWLFALPGIAALHVAALAALHLAERRAPAPAPRRIERWVGSAFFPPALLRTPVELVSARLAGFHPATAAAALLDPDAFVRELRREIGRLGSQPAAAGGSDDAVRAGWCECLREALLSLCEQRGVDRRRVLAPGRVQPTARSYCPLCLDEFLVRSGRCGGCGAGSVGYE